MRIFNRKYLVNLRQNLRNNSTQAEKLLWQYLKQSQLKGRKFRRQQSIKNYMVDFYCPSEKLVIELDGDFHFDEKAKQDDTKRTQSMNKLGIKVIRIENQEVLYDLENVLKLIEKEFSN